MADVPFMVLPVALGPLSCGNERAEAPASHLGEFAYRGMVWRSNGASSLVVFGDFGAPQEIDFVALLGTNGQPGTLFSFRMGNTEAAAVGGSDYIGAHGIPLISPAITRPDGVYHGHLELPSPITRRYWWIRIDGHTGDFEASMLVMGKKIRPSHYYDTAWKRGVRDLGSISFGRNGVPAIAEGSKLRTLDYTLGWATEAEAETMLAPLDERVGRTTPFLTCFDPAPTVYRQARTFFGWNEEQPSIGKVAWNRYERNYQILSLF